MNPDPNQNPPQVPEMMTIPMEGPVHVTQVGINGVEFGRVYESFSDLLEGLAEFQSNNCKGQVCVTWDNCPEVQSPLPEPNFGGLGRGGGVRLTTGLR